VTLTATLAASTSVSARALVGFNTQLRTATCPAAVAPSGGAG
jgi:hypothetical protein